MISCRQTGRAPVISGSAIPLPGSTRKSPSSATPLIPLPGSSSSVSGPTPDTILTAGTWPAGSRACSAATPERIPRLPGSRAHLPPVPPAALLSRISAGTHSPRNGAGPTRRRLPGIPETGYRASLARTVRRWGFAEPVPGSRRLAVSAEFGAWLRRQREARGWSRHELARRMTDAAGTAVTPTAHALESYLSRWESGNAKISGRYRQLIDAVLGPGGNVPVPRPFPRPAPDARKWVRAMQAIKSDIADGEWKPGDQLPVRSALAQRYGFTVETVMRAQAELLSTGVLRKGQAYGGLYVSQTKDQQAPGASLPAAPGPDDPGGDGAVSPPVRAGGGGTGKAPPLSRNPRAYAPQDTPVP